MRQRGFTLIELLVVLAIIGFMAALVPPTFQRLAPGLGTKAAAREFAAVFREARSIAIRENRVTTVTIEAGTGTYRLDGRAASETGDTEVRFGPDTLAPGTTSTVRFFPDGSSTGGSVFVANKTSEYEIVVDWLTGHVEITN